MDETGPWQSRPHRSGPAHLAVRRVLPKLRSRFPRPLTSNARAEGRYDRRDFVYDANSDTYVCPAGERLSYRMTTEEAGKVLRRYWTNACGTCALKQHCTPGKERRIARWGKEAVLDRAQKRVDQHPDAMIVRRSTVEHPFGTIKAWMGATHFKTKTLACRHRDGVARARLQHQARDRDPRRAEANQGDRGFHGVAGDHDRPQEGGLDVQEAVLCDLRLKVGIASGQQIDPATSALSVVLTRPHTKADIQCSRLARVLYSHLNVCWLARTGQT